MSASGRTQNFAIPIYQLGDTCEYIPSYNSGMEIIDAQMQENKTRGLQNTSALDSQGQLINNIENQITEINNDIGKINKREVIIPTINTQNIASAVCEPNLTNINDNMFTLNFAVNISKKDNAVPVVISANGHRYMPIASCAGNIFNLATGATNLVDLGPGMIRYTINSNSNLNSTLVHAWYDGAQTQIAMQIGETPDGSILWNNTWATFTFPIEIL